MGKKLLQTYILFILLFTTCLAYGQKAVTYSIDGSKITATINVNSTNLDSVLHSFGFEETDIQRLVNSISEKGWLCVQANSETVKLSLDKNQKVKDLPPSFKINDAAFTSSTYFDQPPYGFNHFKKQTVITKNGLTRFFLEDHQKAQSVHLSGSFNEWSTLSLPMSKTTNGWEIELKLPAGKHLYKFIVDGYWTEDKQNKRKEDDWNGGYNSVYFVSNQVFYLKGKLDAKKVALAGSFNDWRDNELYLSKTKGGWQIELYIRPGTHAYKYVVDGKWLLDPRNPIVRDDGTGNQNNFMSVGDTLYFRLQGYHSAKEVYCAGDFNGWNWNELKMYKSSRGWIIPYVLAPGNYEYKFKVDGNYITDPYNLLTVGEGDYRNSLKIVDPNTSFVLKGHPEAKSVRLSGTFNGWNTAGYTMRKKGQEWFIDIHLEPGKHLYKFIVDGEWIKDPSNDLWERNEFDSQNSIIWVKPLN